MVLRRSRDGEGPPISAKALKAAAKRIDEQIERHKQTAAVLETQAKEYEDVRSVLVDLPSKVEHQIMVPFGPLAFFAGRLEHTGEVLAQLSSEWFALRTTTHAIGLLDRRRARLQGNQADVAREVRELEGRRHVAAGALGETSDGARTAVPSVPGATVREDEDGFFDIREPYCDGGGEASRSVAAAAPPAATADASADVLQRLRALERQEEGDDDEAPALPPALAPAPAPAPTPAPSPARASAGAGAGATLGGEEAPMARLRALERQEEEDELAGLDEIMEACERATDATASSAVSALSPPPRPGVAAPTPADLYDLMRQTEEATSGRGRGAVEGGRAAAGGFEEIGVSNAGGTVRQFTGEVRERPAAPAAAAPAAAGADAPRERVSKFKSDRMRRG